MGGKIKGYIGGLGSGKTYSMMYDTWQAFRKYPFDVYSNMAYLNCPESRYIQALDDFPAISNGRALLDEVHMFMGSRAWQSVPASMLMALAMGRKNGIEVHWTAHTLERVDKVLREITHELVFCSRLPGPFISQTSFHPGEKRGKFKVVKIRPEVYRLYDTLETIGGSGGSSGRGREAQALTTVARRRVSAEDERRKRVRVPEGTALYYDDWVNCCYTMRKDAEKSLRYLKQRGLYDDRKPMGEQVRQEMERQAWLKTWGLRPDDAPIDCTRAAPWLKGHDPAAVELRLSQERLEMAGEVVKIETRKQRGQAANGRSAVGGV